MGTVFERSILVDIIYSPFRFHVFIFFLWSVCLPSYFSYGGRTALKRSDTVRKRVLGSYTRLLIYTATRWGAFLFCCTLLYLPLPLDF